MPWLIKFPSGRKGKVKRTPSIFRTLSIANQVSEWPLSDSDNGSRECDSMVIKSGDYCDTDCCCCCSHEASVHHRHYTWMCSNDCLKAQWVTFTLIFRGNEKKKTSVHVSSYLKSVEKNNFSVFICDKSFLWQLVAQNAALFRVSFNSFMPKPWTTLYTGIRWIATEWVWVVIFFLYKCALIVSTCFR